MCIGFGIDKFKSMPLIASVPWQTLQEKSLSFIVFHHQGRVYLSRYVTIYICHLYQCQEKFKSTLTFTYVKVVYISTNDQIFVTMTYVNVSFTFVKVLGLKYHFSKLQIQSPLLEWRSMRPKRAPKIATQSDHELTSIKANDQNSSERKAHQNKGSIFGRKMTFQNSKSDLHRSNWN